MQESEPEIQALQVLLDRSAAAVRSEQLRNIFELESNAVSARQLIGRLQGVQHAALATVTAGGEPRVAPMDCFFLHARFIFSTSGDTARAANLRRRPALSLTCFEGDDYAVIVHGAAVSIRPGHPEFAVVDAQCIELYGSSALSWGTNVIYFRVEPGLILGFDRRPEQFSA
jgi:hypothetical protein